MTPHTFFWQHEFLKGDCNLITYLGHEVSIKRIVHYFIITKYKIKGNNEYRGLIVYPTYDLALDSFAANNFYGLWGCENDQYPLCVMSRNGFVMNLISTIVLWNPRFIYILIWLLWRHKILCFTFYEIVNTFVMVNWGLRWCFGIIEWEPIISLYSGRR